MGNATKSPENSPNRSPVTSAKLFDPASSAQLFEESTETFLKRAWRTDDVQPDALWQAKRDLAETVHQLVCATSMSDAPTDVLQGAVAALQSQLAVLRAQPSRSFHEAYKDGSYYADPKRYTDRVFLVGRSNPAVPQLVTTFDDDQSHQTGALATGRITFDESCVGAPGWTHGGLVATAFDQIMGYRLICEGLPVVTGELTVRYLQPTPLHKEVTYTAQLNERGERRATLSAQAHIDGALIGEASAVFVIIPKGSWKL